MRKNKGSVLTKIIIILVLVIVIALGIRYVYNQISTPDTSAIQESFGDIQELATEQYEYTIADKYENTQELFGIKIPFTTESFVIKFSGTIKAGVNLEKAKVTASGKHVTVTLPKVTTLSHTTSKVTYLDRHANILNPSNPKSSTELVDKLKEKEEKRAIKKGLYTKAEKKLESAITEDVKKVAGNDIGVKIVFQ
ncbi:DUF4230 domain-containing protein [Sharpea azabuensis]|uniref:DUF4230 domain-containing protein n=1 Tax=Sharpea azabuensis TaxID=322505 RepID=A0A1H6U1E5_9FIRM|nr:DUF4230 domain-containing protein [Sharpea azabuensis]MDD6512257.1 DUF4230 domain-containing protein [Sharpea azabuensis]SEI86103.1 Protein of unknown function [Sharpea azabuensis]